MTEKTRYQISLDIARCVWDELKLNIHVHYNGYDIYIELPYAIPIYPTAIGKKLDNYLQTVFTLDPPSHDFDEHKLSDDSWCRTFVYKVDEGKWNEIQSLLKIKGY